VSESESERMRMRMGWKKRVVVCGKSSTARYSRVTSPMILQAEGVRGKGKQR